VCCHDPKSVAVLRQAVRRGASNGNPEQRRKRLSGF
jgi:hypothetical protein